MIDLNNAMNVELTASDPGDLLSSAVNNYNNSSDMADGLEHAIGQCFSASAYVCSCGWLLAVACVWCISSKRKEFKVYRGNDLFP